MDTFRKWWNKPKADDNSILARFYFADRSLTAIASELDSFDGRAEPERCSRLVARLRQGQDQVLSITNVIMDELLVNDRTPRAFRAKFPEEVLQESLAGQLWFGAECLAAGSSIMNREIESATMRPLARAVTKSLDNVRNLLREQCLRIKTPNQTCLNLDTNDSITENLCESLKIFDRLFAEFELLYVSAMVQVKSKHEHETQELICVLFSETLQRAMRIGHLCQEQVDYFDPALMFSIPRLAIVSGLIVYRSGPLNLSKAEQLSEMFRPFRPLLIKIRDLLESLTPAELFQLEQLLSTNEEIATESTAPGLPSSGGGSYANCDGSSKEANVPQLSKGTPVIIDSSSNNRLQIDASYQLPSTTSNATDGLHVNLNAVEKFDWDDKASDSSTKSSDEFFPTEDRIEFGDKKAMEESIESVSDVASGFLISNTNLGSMLQMTDALLTDRFVASDDELNAGIESDSDKQLHSGAVDSGHGTCENTSQERTPDSEENHVVAGEFEPTELSRKYSANWERLNHTANPPPNAAENPYPSTSQTPQFRTQYARRSQGSEKHSIRKPKSSSSSSSSAGSTALRTPSTNNTHSRKKLNRSVKTSSSAAIKDSSGEDSSSSSGGDAKHEYEHTRVAARMKFKSTENLLHRLFVCIAGVADQLQTNFASDLRQILRSVFLMNMSPSSPEEIEILGIEKPKDADGVAGDLFEFRASENDVVIHRGEREGSNQSIYSAAEEANAEDTDSVFGLCCEESLNTRRQERSASFESDVQGVTRIGNCGVPRTRSLGDESTDSGDGNYPSENALQIAPFGRTATVSVPMRRLSGSAGSSPVGSQLSGSSSPTQISTSPDIQRKYSRRHCERTPSVEPPRWIPDEEAPRCMLCAQEFTTFRRRHHCRNCGGVFCGVCSAASAPLPKFGLIKAVRVCRECFLTEVV